MTKELYFFKANLGNIAVMLIGAWGLSPITAVACDLTNSNITLRITGQSSVYCKNIIPTLPDTCWKADPHDLTDLPDDCPSGSEFYRCPLGAQQANDVSSFGFEIIVKNIKGATGNCFTGQLAQASFSTRQNDTINWSLRNKTRTEENPKIDNLVLTKINQQKILISNIYSDWTKNNPIELYPYFNEVEPNSSTPLYGSDNYTSPNLFLAHRQNSITFYDQPSDKIHQSPQFRQQLAFISYVGSGDPAIQAPEKWCKFSIQQQHHQGAIVNLLPDSPCQIINNP